MTDREKLVELLARVMTNAMYTGSDNGGVVVHYVSVEQIADHLIAHGVTVK
jgi:hypothetical protein